MQFFLQIKDDELFKYLKIFTFLPLEDFPRIGEHHQKDPSLRYGQKLLAEEVVELVHGGESFSCSRRQA
jgi:tyrosyl-tRNA synthetase